MNITADRRRETAGKGDGLLDHDDTGSARAGDGAVNRQSTEFGDDGPLMMIRSS